MEMKTRSLVTFSRLDDSEERLRQVDVALIDTIEIPWTP